MEKEEKKIFLKWLEKQRKIRSDSELLDGLIRQLKKEIRTKEARKR